MTISVDLTPDVVDRLRRQAFAQGSDLPDFVRRLAEREAQDGYAGAGIAALRGAYHVEDEDWDAVSACLELRPELVGLLSEARHSLSRIFSEGAPVRLHLVREEGEDFSLSADVLAGDPLAAFEKMSRFDAEWWLDASERAGGFLRFNVEFA